MNLLSPIRKVNSFFAEVKNELKKVSWSTRQELVKATIVVLVGSTLLTIFILVTDYILNQALQFLIS